MPRAGDHRPPHGEYCRTANNPNNIGDVNSRLLLYQHQRYFGNDDGTLNDRSFYGKYLLNATLITNYSSTLEIFPSEMEIKVIRFCTCVQAAGDMTRAWLYPTKRLF